MKMMVKGILLWGTILATVMFLMAIDSLSRLPMWIWYAVTVVLVIICKCVVTLDEFKKLTGVSFLSKYFPEMFEEEG